MSLITVQFSAGKVEVKARVFGPLAVHYALSEAGEDQKHFTITHVPTGHSVSSFDSKDKALYFASELALLDIWDFTDPEAIRERSERLSREYEAVGLKWLRAEMLRRREVA